MSVKSIGQQQSARDGTEYSAGVAYPIINNTNYDGCTIYDDGGHYGYPDFPPDRNVGGTLLITGERWRQGASQQCVAWRGGANNQKYVGCFRAQVTRLTGTLATLDGSAYAADAYNRMKPTKPVFNTLNSVYELKDLPGMLRQRFHSSGLKNIGSYYLGYQFGWKPLLQDLISLFTIQQQLEKRLDWLLRHNGKPVRRRVVLAESTSDPGIASGNWYGGLYPVLVTQYYTRQPTYLEKTWVTDKVWASARFRYWLPDGPRGIIWTAKMRAALLGLNPSPSVVYRAMPWSWLIDWFTNVGKVIQNAESGVADRLAADYFYVMRERHWIRTCETVGYFRDPTGNNFTVSAKAQTEKFTKHRLKGDPFGFNTNQNSLNGTQLAILGALGLSRVR